jgi:hypothetical protein
MPRESRASSSDHALTLSMIQRLLNHPHSPPTMTKPYGQGFASFISIEVISPRRTKSP